MFKWFEYASVKGRVVRIVDDDFNVILDTHHQRGDSCFVDLIKIYEAKNLPVVPNLIRAMKYHSRIHDGYPIIRMIETVKAQSKIYAPYAQELDKYLILT